MIYIYCTIHILLHLYTSGFWFTPLPTDVYFVYFGLHPMPTDVYFVYFGLHPMPTYVFFVYFALHHCPQTYISSILLSLNPYKQLPIYSPATIGHYRRLSQRREPLPPHVFALADAAFSQLETERSNQSVVIRSVSYD